MQLCPWPFRSGLEPVISETEPPILHIWLQKNVANVATQKPAKSLAKFQEIVALQTQPEQIA